MKIKIKLLLCALLALITASCGRKPPTEEDASSPPWLKTAEARELIRQEQDAYDASQDARDDEDERLDQAWDRFVRAKSAWTRYRQHYEDGEKTALDCMRVLTDYEMAWPDAHHGEKVGMHDAETRALIEIMLREAVVEQHTRAESAKKRRREAQLALSALPPPATAEELKNMTTEELEAAVELEKQRDSLLFTMEHAKMEYIINGMNPVTKE